MPNIGSQKAVGYRSVQIISAIVMQYGLITLAGDIVGNVLAGFLLPFIAKIFEPQIALVWNPGFDLNFMLISILSVLLAVMLIVFLTSRKINKLHPLVALRGGTSTHSFKKNRFPLDKTRGPFNFLLALKQIIQNKKQAVTVGMIVAALTMASVFGISLNYSMHGGKNVFLHSMFDEVPFSDAAFMLESGMDGEAFSERLLQYPEIRKVLAYQASGISLLVDDINILVHTTEDFSSLESQMLIEGYYPKHDNEIVLGSLVLKATDKKIGDTVTIRLNEVENDYIITGIVQSLNSDGFFGLFTLEGVRAVSPDFMFTDFLVYMNEGADAKSVIEEIQEEEGDIFETVMNMQDQIGITFDKMSGMFAAVALGIMAVTVFVVVLTLYMVIKTTVLRRRRELGIQKAVGFTTLQLMNQIALNMTPIILLGVAIGAVAGYFGFNPLFKAMLSGVGVAKSNLPVPLDQIIIICILLIILAYAVSMLIAWRIKKISAYTMISD